MKEKNTTRPRYFDLEEEDGMAMADQAPEEIEDFFIRVTFGSTQTKSFEVQEQNLIDSVLVQNNSSYQHDPTPRPPDINAQDGK